MQLYWSSRSPFVRKVMVVAHEHGLAERIEKRPIVVSTMKAGRELLPVNPLGKIPTLVLEDGGALYDSSVICEYFDGIGQGPKLFPAAGPARFTALRRQALGTGLMDMLVTWRGELARPHPAAGALEGFGWKLAASLQALEAEAEALATEPYGIGQISIGAALAYLDFRWPEENWRTAHPRLADFQAGFTARPAVQATAHIDA
ncbi:glutathione S-transferase [Siccirubricoccus sp. KC 17139]|uniref:Glutathione S-transferase n=1 Tax=Siccirubricoccus soli TaxID=2899147 RepID=A0ABT1D5X8_9PROT|nr:glutathione S-transferase [Siccirubricoccus soli]MCO6417333.1 glutathione S-transferase [Siccirubricoccus soli]MCP2683468.1 glutathione S-transferase [Siccirubricoccus soli]